MPQRRLEHYFISSRAPFIPSGCSFLNLPHSVRRLIYEFIELDRIFVDLNYSNLQVYPKGEYPETRDCRKLDSNGCYNLEKLDVTGSNEVWEINEAEDIKSYGSSPWGRGYGLHQSMLLVSKQIHKEVEAFTYARAVFRVCLGQPLGFTRLWRMSDNALSILGTLTIRLNTPKTVVSNDRWLESDSQSPYLDFSTKWGKSVLKDWVSTLHLFARSVKPGMLRLHVIFCAKTIDDARAIIEPMMQLPRMKDCGICAELYGQNCWDRQNYYMRSKFPINEETEISQLVQRVIRKLTLVHDTATAPFRYLDLPQEIRFAILKYTDLVSPDAVQWRPRKWIGTHPHCTYCTSSNYGETMDEFELSCSCHSYPGSNIDDLSGIPCCESCRSNNHSGICYCSARGPIWSSSCKCQLPRRTLFSVSRKVRQDAIPIYYACNQILVTSYNSPIIRYLEPYDWPWPATGIHFLPKIELSLYLSSITHSALQHIRWLEWILPSSQRTYLLPRTPAWFDYLDTLLLMENAMNVSALTFTINISASGQCSNDYEYHKRMLLNEDAWRWYETIVLPVKRLGEAGLKNFFVYLRRFDIEEGRRVHREQDLERAVMGKDYTSAQRGKPVERMHVLSKELRQERERMQREWRA